MNQSKQSAIIFKSNYLKTDKLYFNTETTPCNNYRNITDKNTAYVCEDYNL